jgi:hypothetical protein
MEVDANMRLLTTPIGKAVVYVFPSMSNNMVDVDDGGNQKLDVIVPTTIPSCCS